MMDFGQAFERALDGSRITRAGWNGIGLWLEAQWPNETSKMTLPFLSIHYPKGHKSYPVGAACPWLASQTDLFATDWMIAP